ncbi:Probable galacturonosyltransferase 11 [Striga hermonthica]|uniref:Hexosyltransferase n=1 Tax=Striga hermonthica TaxID=68872 RepID=A0A9N7RA75_STRHE|nr:Probable galacturonosyltransferase 11 [Striga hermonthica]
MTMKSHIQALEERANTASIQGTIFGQLASESIPKNIECINIKLTAEWLQNKSLQLLSDQQEKKISPRLVDNNLYHLCIFSDNPLAVSVVVNSTVSNAEHPKQLVFHVVTNGVKYGAMQAWFISNDFRGATIEVQNIEEFTWLDPKYFHNNPKYISLLNHLRFYVPEIYPQVEKVIFLDDDIVVQKDLTKLFSLDLHGNANGAVETCLEAFHRYYKHLNFSNPIISTKFDPQACGWAFGMNVFDLIAWRRENVISRYHFWVEKNTDRLIWKLGTLPPGLLTFYGLTEPLDQRWHLEKVIFLDDDIVVQKDLTELFSLDLHGNVNGAVETCLEAFHQYYKYLNFSNPIISTKFDPQACGWAFGMNVFDLIAWRRENVTSRYHFWVEKNTDRLIWKLGTLPPGLLTCYGLTEPLDQRWHVLGLGYDMNIDNG